MESSPQFIANHDAMLDEWKRAKIATLVMMLDGAYAARDKVGLKMNLLEEKLPAMLHALPALRNPTVSHLANRDWVALETIIDQASVREIIPKLKALGAEGIIEYPLNKLVY